MFGNRYEIVVHLKALTDLHLGTGDTAPFENRSKDEPEGEYRTVVKDHQDRPYISGSTLKGALRYAIEKAAAPAEAIKNLFGLAHEKIGDNIATGFAGRMLVRGAEHVSTPAIDKLPYVATENLKHTYIAARTSIDGATGVAENHKLFFTEMIPAGTIFKWTSLLTDEKSKPALEEGLKTLLAQGLQLGGGKSDGQGELCVEGDIEITPYKVDAEGNLRAGTVAFLKRDNNYGTPNDALTFLCEGPFIVNDSSWNSTENRKTDARGKEVQAVQSKAQRRAEHMPLLLGTSISGLLRARAKWLQALDADLNGDPSLIDRLFGKQDFQALISLRNLRVSGAKPFQLTSLKIDRFSGAPIDGALFTTETFVGTRISFSLHCRANLKPLEQVLYEKLKADIINNGMCLGHGTNKGFGWFKAETVGVAHAA